MDIGALLAQSNLEVTGETAYDTDDFEDEAVEDNKGSSKPAAVADVLKAAAVQVAVEEKKDADRVFNEAANTIENEIKASKLTDKDADAILAKASREVNEHYNRKVPQEAEKYRAVEEKENEPVVEVKVEKENEDEGEDDEEEELNEDPELNQALFFAVYNEKVEALKTALRKGAYYFARDRHGWTPLHWAASRGYVDIIEVLVAVVKDKGRNVVKYVNAQDTLTGWTALHVACVGGHLHAIETLLQYGARKNKLNFLKEKPSDCIGKSKYPREIRTLLGVPLRPKPTEVTQEYAPDEGKYSEDDAYFNDTVGRESGRPPRRSGSEMNKQQQSSSGSNRYRQQQQDSSANSEEDDDRYYNYSSSGSGNTASQSRGREETKNYR